ncbi:MAG: hypothetical protein U0792_04500 [Gemmataceae bacterium]
MIPGNSFTPGGTNYEYVTGSGPGVQASVKVYDANGALRYTLQPFANYTGGVNVAVADVTHTVTSVAGVSSASMAGSGTVTVNTTIPHGYTVGQTVNLSNVNAFDAMGNLVYSYDGDYTITAVDSPFSFQFITDPPLMTPPTAFGGTAGVYQKDLIVSTAAGTTGRVRVYSFEGNTLRSVSLFQPFGPNYVGGVELTTGDVSGDFTKEIIVGQQTNGSIVKVFAVDPTSGGRTYFQTRRFQAFEAGYTGGVSIASANIDATENTSTYNYDYSEILVGKAKNAPLLKIFDAQKPTVTVRAQYFVFTPNVPSVNVGINVAAGNTDGLRGAEIYVSLVNTTNVRIFNGQTGTTISDFTVPYPTGYGRNLCISINDLGDVLAPDSSPVSDASLATNLFVVASDGPNAQIPLIFPGQYFSPAGLNGFHAAP